MAVPVFFIDSVLNADVTVAQAVNLETAAAEVEIFAAPVGRESGFFRLDISRIGIIALGVGYIGRLAEAAVFDKGQPAGVIEAVFSVFAKQKRV